MRRLALAIGSVALVAFGIACVDLFHSTDFPTLCSTTPSDPSCGGSSDAAPDAPVDGGVDASRPHPDFCASTSVEALANAKRACAWLGACEGPLGESAFGPCVVRAQLAFDCKANPGLRPRGSVDAFWGCLSTVKSCGDVDACVFPAGVQECNAVAAPGSSACGTLPANAADHIECMGPMGRAFGIEPCVMFGKSCATENPSVAYCAGPLGLDKCTRRQCSGTMAVDCTTDGGTGARMLDKGIDCAGYGAGSCFDDSVAGPACAPSAGTSACSGTSAVSCSANIASSCVNGHEVVVRCDLLGVPCDVSIPPSPYDPAAACVDRTTSACAKSDECVGTQIESCGHGTVRTLDCATIGLGPCRKNASGLASCSPPAN